MIRKRQQEKTTFTCPYGTICHTTLALWLLHNAPGTFQSCVMAIFHVMFRKKRWKCFMDDFSVFGSSSIYMLKNHLERCLSGCDDTNLALILGEDRNAIYMVKEGMFFDHIFSNVGYLRSNELWIDVIAKLHHQTNVKGHPLFLGHAGSEIATIGFCILQEFDFDIVVTTGAENTSGRKTVPLGQDKLDDALWAFRTAYKTPSWVYSHNRWIARIVKNSRACIFIKSFTSSASFWESIEAIDSLVPLDEHFATFRGNGYSRKRAKRKPKTNKSKHGVERAKAKVIKMKKIQLEGLKLPKPQVVLQKRKTRVKIAKKPCWQSLTFSMAEIVSKEAQKKSKAGICFRLYSHNKHTSFLLSKEAQAASPRDKELALK
ncbi:hypothetical protein Tco_0839887 [Tanacetum coccineum]|uniref:Reverse transcriptase domain-containing protein n=1 Tax=Tanacetum coccineum TaxID=301880 RepID=A0ABQ5AS01_9ASTR